jgi:DedD protein
MEKKKLLLVTISVGVFLVVVIGASILIFSPRNPTPVVAAAARPERPIPAGIPGTLNSSVVPEDVSNIIVTPGDAVTPEVPDRVVGPGVTGSPVPVLEGPLPEAGQDLALAQPATADPTEMVRNSGNYQGLQSPPSSSAAIQENSFYIDNESTQPVVAERRDEEGNSQVVINVPRPQTAAVPNESSSASASQRGAGRTAASSGGGSSANQTAAAKAATSSRTTNLAAKTSTPARTAAPAAKAATPVKTTTPAARTAALAKTAEPPAASRPAAVTAAPQPQTRVYDAYWVQTGSFPTRIQADKAKDILASKGLTAIIENGDVKGQTWYRVRVGPYTSQNEADYWLSLIKAINGTPYIDLASSIVWKSQARP